MSKNAIAVFNTLTTAECSHLVTLVAGRHRNGFVGCSVADQHWSSVCRFQFETIEVACCRCPHFAACDFFRENVSEWISSFWEITENRTNVDSNAIALISVVRSWV